MIKDIFKTEESRFSLINAFKFMIIPFMILFFTMFILWIFARINFLFFESNGFVQMQIDKVGEAYFDFIAEDAISMIPYIFFFFILVFFIGLFFSFFLLRPFHQIGEYCNKKLNGEKILFKNNGIFNSRLPVEFGEYFFAWVDETMNVKIMEKGKIPPYYQKIHGPLLEKNFFIFFMLVVLGLIVLSSFVIYFVGMSMHERIVTLAIEVFKKRESLSYFLQGQGPLIMTIMIVILGVMFFLFFFLAINLYAQIAGASFAIFSTMRAFMKGDFSARVHLVEYRYVREHCRYLNKYLNYVEDNLKKK